MGREAISGRVPGCGGKHALHGGCSGGDSQLSRCENSPRCPREPWHRTSVAHIAGGGLADAR